MFSDDSARVGTYDTFYGYGTVGTVGTVRWVRWGTVRWVRWVRYGGYGVYLHPPYRTHRTQRTAPFTVPSVLRTVPPHRALLLKFDKFHPIRKLVFCVLYSIVCSSLCCHPSGRSTCWAGMLRVWQATAWWDACCWACCHSCSPVGAWRPLLGP